MGVKLLSKSNKGNKRKLKGTFITSNIMGVKMLNKAN